MRPLPGCRGAIRDGRRTASGRGQPGRSRAAREGRRGPGLFKARPGGGRADRRSGAARLAASCLLSPLVGHFVNYRPVQACRRTPEGGANLPTPVDNKSDVSA